MIWNSAWSFLFAAAALAAASTEGAAEDSPPGALRFIGSGRRGTTPTRQSALPPVVDPEALHKGRALFERDWMQSGPLPGTSGDGLGPMSNAASCVACHKAGAPGGAAPNDGNVDLLSLVPSPSQLARSDFEARAMNVHPGFSKSVTSVILHRQMAVAGDPRKTDNRYDGWRYRLLASGTRRELSRANPNGIIGGIRVRFSQRNTPPLFGAGLIDAIPDHLLVAIADEQREHHPGTAGRIARAAGGSVGRFGWRGQVAHLHDFVLAACANELGLEVPGNRQPPRISFQDDDASLGKAYFSREEQRKAADDLSEEQCRALTTFVGGLLPPARGSAASVAHARDIAAGESLFAEIGCAECHRREIGPIDGIYSDLLLHDMGEELADPVAAIPDNGGQFIPSVGAYYGSTSEALPIASGRRTNTKQEWRTPPLWGVADSGPWLHDGRAATLDDAVRLHGGQGRRSARQFGGLTESDRTKVLNFLASLAAPRVDGVAQPPVRMLPVAAPTGFLGFGNPGISFDGLSTGGR